MALVSKHFLHNVGTLVFGSWFKRVASLETIDVIPSVVNDRLDGVPSFDVGLGLPTSTLDEELRIWGSKFHAPCLGSDVVVLHKQ
jgi:hypothetical protein